MIILTKRLTRKVLSVFSSQGLASPAPTRDSDCWIVSVAFGELPSSRYQHSAHFYSVNRGVKLREANK